MYKYNLVEYHYKALVLNTIYQNKKNKELFYKPRPMVRGLGYRMGRC